MAGIVYFTRGDRQLCPSKYLACGVNAASCSPAIGAVLTSVSTVIVAINAQLLRRARLAWLTTLHYFSVSMCDALSYAGTRAATYALNARSTTRQAIAYQSGMQVEFR